MPDNIYARRGDNVRIIVQGKIEHKEGGSTIQFIYKSGAGIKTMGACKFKKEFYHVSGMRV